MFDFLKPKPKKVYILEEPEPSSPFLFEIDMSTVGEDYHCRKDPKMARSYWIKQLKQNEHVSLEQYKYQGKSAISINNARGLDVAKFPEPFAIYLSGLVEKMELRGIVSQLEPLRVLVRVYGEYKRKYVFYDGAPGKRGKEYTYNISNQDNRYLLYPPDIEVMCECREIDGGYSIFVGDEIIGFIIGDRAERLKNMLSKYDCITSVKIEPYSYSVGINMMLRF